MSLLPTADLTADEAADVLATFNGEEGYSRWFKAALAAELLRRKTQIARDQADAVARAAEAEAAASLPSALLG